MSNQAATPPADAASDWQYIQHNSQGTAGIERGDMCGLERDAVYERCSFRLAVHSTQLAGYRRY